MLLILIRWTVDLISHFQLQNNPVLAVQKALQVIKHKIFKLGMWLKAAHAWFLEIAFVCALVCVCMSVCVSAPKSINNQWHDIDHV